MTDQNAPAPPPTRGWKLIIPGAVMLVLGIILAVSTFGRETPGENDPAEFAAWNAGTTIGSAVLIGIGILLVALGSVRRRRRDVQRS
jgi:hypothetical protein